MTWDDVENTVTMARLEAYGRYWENHPPLHVIAAAMAGVEPKKKKKLADLSELISSFPTGAI